MSKANDNKNYWKTFILLHKKLYFLCQTTEAYSRRCTPLLCIVFPVYITVQCYLIYIFVFIEISQPQMGLFHTSFVECNLFLFVITSQCAIVVKKFSFFERLSTKFIFEHFFKQKQKCKQVTGQLVKMDFFQGNKRLHRYAFKLFAYIRITSKTYYVVRNKKQKKFNFFIIFLLLYFR